MRLRAKEIRISRKREEEVIKLKIKAAHAAPPAPVARPRSRKP